MAGTAGFSVTISAVDRFSATMAKMNKKIADAGAPVKRAQAQLAKFGEVSGLSKVSKSFSDIRNSATDAFQKISSIVTPLGAISGAASVAGMARMVSAWSDWGSRLSFASKNIGVSADKLSDWQGAARLAGSSADAMTSGVQALGQNMFDAAGGRNAEFIVLMNSLGYKDLPKAAVSAKDVSDALAFLTDKIKSVKDPYVAAKIATEAFSGAGMDLLPLLRQGSDGIDRLTAMAEKYNPVTQQSIDAANAFRISQTKLTLATEGLGNSISTALSPVLSPVLDNMADWIAKNRDWIGQDIASHIGDIGRAVAVVGAVMGGSFALKLLAPWVSLVATIGRGSAAMWRFAAAEEGAGVAGAGLGAKGILGKLFGLLGKGFIAEALVNAIDPNDDAGAWIDRNIPGAAGVDNFASHLGLGRSYAQQGGGSASMPMPSSADQSVAAQHAMSYFVGQGWSPAQAAGIAANLQRESGFNAGAVGDHGNALGLAQWRADRAGAIQQHFGKSVSQMSLDEQLGAVNWELRSGGEKQAGDILGMQNDAQSAGAAVSAFYERPLDSQGEQDARGSLAEAIASKFSIATAQGPALAIAPPSGAAGAGGDGVITVRLHHANQPPPGFGVSIADTSGSMAGARVAQANVTGALP